MYPLRWWRVQVVSVVSRIQYDQRNGIAWSINLQFNVQHILRTREQHRYTTPEIKN